MPDPCPRIFRNAARHAARHAVAAVAIGVIAAGLVGGLAGGLGGCVASRSSDWAQTAPAIPPVRHARDLPATDELFVTRRDRTAGRSVPTASPARN